LDLEWGYLWFVCCRCSCVFIFVFHSFIE
jgi:hypothetical protein